MKKIITILRPFVLNQLIYVYDDGNQIDIFETTIEDLPHKIIEITEKYNINQVDISGPTQYAKGIINKITQKETEKYSMNKLTFTCI